MSESPPARELRRSVSLLATEWWLLVGLVAGYLVYGVWVVATGLVLDAVAPSATVVTTVGPAAVTAATVVAVFVWLLIPAVVVTWLLERRLANPHGNLVSHYRVDNPGALPAPSGVAMVLFVAAAVAVGPVAPVVALGTLASAHLFVRTVAFGRRVYSFSPRMLFPVLTAVSAGAFATAWLVHAPRLPGPVGERLGAAGVATVTEPALELAGTTPATLAGVLVTVPALLAGVYLLAQTVAAGRTRSRAPLADPDKRAEQRFPIMPPVPAGERPGGTPAASSAAGNSSSASDTSSAEPPTESGATSQTPVGGSDTADSSPSDDRSSTRVFTSDEPVPEGDGAVTRVPDDDEDDGWIDDTSIFSPDRGSGESGECGACGDPLPSDASVTFCPNCGQKI